MDDFIFVFYDFSEFFGGIDIISNVVRCNEGSNIIVVGVVVDCNYWDFCFIEGFYRWCNGVRISWIDDNYFG